MPAKDHSTKRLPPPPPMPQMKPRPPQPSRPELQGFVLKPPLEQGTFHQAKNGKWYSYAGMSIANRIYLEEMFEFDKCKHPMTPPKETLTSSKGNNKKYQDATNTRKGHTTEMEHRSSTRLRKQPNFFIREQNVNSKANDRTHGEFSWDKHYENLKDFFATHYHCNPSLISAMGNQALNEWVLEQRLKYRQNELEKSKIQQLESIGFCWDCQAAKLEHLWIRQYKPIASHFRAHGTVSSLKNKKLEQWLSDQRYYFSKGRLLLGRKERLSKINFSYWLPPTNTTGIDPTDVIYSTDSDSDLEDLDERKEGETKDDVKWESHYKDLVDFQNKHHHCIPELVKHQKPAIENWVVEQRHLHSKQLLSVSKKKLLDDIGFSWHHSNSAAYEQQWIKNYTALTRLLKRYGDFSNADSSLKKWMERQRCMFRSSALPLGRKVRLEKINFPFVAKKRSRRDQGPAPRLEKKQRGSPQSAPFPTGTNHHEKNNREDQQVLVRDPFRTLAPLVIKLRSVQIPDSHLVDCYNALQAVSVEQGSPLKQTDRSDDSEDTFSRLLSLTRELRGKITDPQQLEDCEFILNTLLSQHRIGS